MKSSELRARLRKERPKTSITIRMPEDVVDDLKRVAPLLGFSGYQPLIRAYVSQGLRRDLEKVQHRPNLDVLIKSLRQHGVADDVITSAIAEIRSA